jgi:pyruvate/2-oxoglutarate dehydrogenase complex dihydrolipoamide dehydrogenase (E3) component
MDHARSIIKKIGDFEAPEYYEARGIRIHFGIPRFIDKNTLTVDGTALTAGSFIICAGAHPVSPSIEGLESVPYFTNETIFNLQLLPRTLAVLGGGPTGVEIAQAFALLGVGVTLLSRGTRLLPKEDDEAARLLQRELQKNGIAIHTGCSITRIAREEDRRIMIEMHSPAGEPSLIRTEMLFVATGTAANVEGLGLEKAGIRYSPEGIAVDDTLRTSTDTIFACGDIIHQMPFANAARQQATVAVQNALSGGREHVDYHAVPWCVSTDPALAHFGPTEQEARERFGTVEVYKADYRENDRAVADLEDLGFAKVLCDSDGKIIGAHIVGTSAEEIVHPLVVAKAAGMTLPELGSLVFVYPAISETIRQLGEQYALKKNVAYRQFSPVH